MAKKQRSLFLRVFDHKMWLYDIARITGIVPILLFLRTKKIYQNDIRPKKAFQGRYIVSANHTGFKDPVIVMGTFWMRRLGFVATKDLFDNRFKRFLFNHFGCVEIDKENPSVLAFKKVEANLDRGHPMCVFPGGTIVHEDNDDIGTFKSGIVMMAIMAEAEIFPIYIPKRKNVFYRQKVMIGERINYKDYVTGLFPTMADIEKVTNVLLEKELELKNKYLELEIKRRKSKNG